MPLPTQKKFQIECGFSDEDFSNLWNRVRDDLKEPKNAVGLKGPSNQVETKARWSNWFGEYIISSGLAKEYWGIGMKRKWDWALDNEDVRTFLKTFVKYAAQTARNNEAIARRAKESRESPSGSIKSRIPSEDERSFFPTAIKSGSSTIGAHGTPKVVNYRSKFSVSTHQNTPNKSGHDIKQEVALIPKRALKRRRTSNLGLAKEKEGDRAFVPVRLAKSSIEQAGLGRDEFPLISSDNESVADPESSVSSDRGPVSSPSMEYSPMTASALSKIAFETRITGTNRFRIIHATQAPSLLLFIKMMYEKFELDPEQRISTIDVWISNDLLAIDLWEEKDWAHIIKRAVENGSCRVKVEVEMV